MILSFLSVSESYGQTWSMVGGGLSGNWKLGEAKIHTETSIGHLFVAFYDNPSIGTPSNGVRAWDGFTWTPLPPIPNPNYEISDIVVDGSKIYITGNGGPAFYEYNGASWIAKSPIGFSGSTTTAEMINGNLVVGGDFTAAVINDLFYYDGTSFFPYFAPSNTVLEVEDIHLFNGDLFISTRSVAGNGVEGLLKHNGGTSWSEPAHFYQGTTTAKGPLKMFDYQNKLFVAGKESKATILELGQDTLHLTGSLVHGYNDYAIYNGDAFLVGDTPFSPQSLTRINSSLGLTTIFNSPSSLGAIEVYGSDLYVFSVPTKMHRGYTYNHAFKTQGNIATLEGEAFIDKDNTCTKSLIEPNVSNVLVDIGGGNLFSVNKNGQYSVALPAGNYTYGARFHVPQVWAKNIALNCPLPPNVALVANQIARQDIGFVNNTPIDMLTNFFSRGWKRAVYGFDEYYTFNVYNAGNTAWNNATTLTIEIPPTVKLISSFPQPSSTSGNTLTYNYNSVEAMAVKKIGLLVNIDTATHTLGDTIIWRSYLSPIAGDVDPSDNSYEQAQVIVGAYDPNDKQASAKTIALGTKEIDYHIRFQNTGTDTAYKVTVIDTLDVTLPLTKIVINGTSHPYNLRIKNNVLAWEFDSILLPDSLADPIGSQGYINFTMSLNPSLAIGDTVDNDAEIYFDYQFPIHTNHAQTVVVKDDVSLFEYEQPAQVEVYPNPAQEYLNIKNLEARVLEFRLLDASGKTIETFEVRPYEKQIIPIIGLAQGVYFLRSEASSHKIIIDPSTK